MTELPKALFVIDIGKEDLCIAEARRMGVEIFAIVDSDCDPEKVTHTIPGNDDAVRSIRLITGKIASAALEGLALREARMQAEREELELAEREAQMLTEQEEAALDANVGAGDADYPAVEMPEVLLSEMESREQPKEQEADPA